MTQQCKHDMRKIGDLAFECSKCRHTEIGCGHSDLKIKKLPNGKTHDNLAICQICGLEIECHHQEPLIDDLRNMFCKACGKFLGIAPDFEAF